MYVHASMGINSYQDSSKHVSTLTHGNTLLVSLMDGWAARDKNVILWDIGRKRQVPFSLICRSYLQRNKSFTDCLSYMTNLQSSVMQHVYIYMVQCQQDIHVVCMQHSLQSLCISDAAGRHLSASLLCLCIPPPQLPLLCRWWLTGGLTGDRPGPAASLVHTAAKIHIVI